MADSVFKATVTHLREVFQEKYQKTKLEEEESKMTGYMDDANVMMVCPKTKEVLDAFKALFETEPKKVPELDYSDGAKVKLSAEYLKTILKYLIATGEDNIYINAKTDYPITFETEQVKIVLAPRVGDD